MLRLFRDLAPYVRGHAWAYGLGTLMLVVNGYFLTLIPVVPGRAIDRFGDGTMTLSSIWLFLGLVLGASAVSAIAMVIVRRSMLGSSWEIQFDLRRDLFVHFTRLDGGYFDNNRVGDLMARLTADLNAVRMVAGVAIFQGINTVMVMGFTLFRMASLSPGLTLLTLAVVPFISLTFFLLLRIIHRRYQKVQEQFSNVSAMAQENFSGIRVVKGFGIEDREIGSFRSLNDEFIRRNLALTRVDGPLFPLMELLFGLTIALLLLVGGRLVLGVGGNLSIGQFASFVFLFQGIQWPLIALGWIGNMVQRGATSWARLKEILDTEPAIQDDDDTDYSLTSVVGDIEFRDVTITFDGVPALVNVNLHIRAGESIGIAGRTGSGKTLLGNLVARLLDPDSGQILIDGVDIKRYPVKVMRRFVGLVPQEPFLFSDSIADNIAYGIPEGDADDVEARVLRAAEISQLREDVEDFPAGFATSLGERGVTLSGGQRQRTAIARAIVRDPAILIFDDALSAVDTQTEANILSGMRDVQRGRTTIVVAHRVSAFQNCDRVYVLADGSITEQGTHDELMELDGWYADMAHRQQLEADLEAV